MAISVMGSATTAPSNAKAAPGTVGPRSECRARRWLALPLLAAVMVTSACRSGETLPEEKEPAVQSAATAERLPPLELRDGMDGLLLTWVDEEGDFHVVARITDVPEGRREAVRVVVSGRSEGTGQLVYVADLREPTSGGTYPVRTITRAEWEEIGASRRKVRLEALAPKPLPAARGDASAPHAAQPNEVTAVVYGADWCKPCHDAEKLLKKLGVKVTKKDIEKSSAANREMQAKLQRIRRAGASIPVIDVMGKILVGYSPTALRRAVDAARSSEAP